MSGSIARRAVLCTLVTTLLVPVAAQAAPARQSGQRLAVTGMADWSRTLFRSVDSLLDLLRPATAASTTPPGKKPGDDDGGGGQGREGNGLDPHGKPGG